jgi:hypothetical protein
MARLSRSRQLNRVALCVALFAAVAWFVGLPTQDMLKLELQQLKANDQSTSKEKSAEKKDKTSETGEKPKEKSLLEKLSDELLKEVDETPESNPDAGEDVQNKLVRAVKGIRNAGNKLDERLTAEETQKIQKQVIKDLEDIINQLENPPPDQNDNSGGGGGGGGGGGQGGGGGGASSRNRRGGGGGGSLQRRSSGASGRRGSARKQPQTGDNANEPNDGQSKEDATDAGKSLHNDKDKKAAEEAERRRKLEMDIWGHLPPHVREELLSTYGERILPKYEQLVKQFYEVLSTQGDSKSTPGRASKNP